MDVGEQIRFRLLDQHFVEQAPVRKEVLMAAKLAAMNPSTINGTVANPPVGVETLPEQSPYRLTVGNDQACISF